MSWFKRPVLATKSGIASFSASRIAEYPVKLETETIGYISGQFGTTTTDSRTWYGAAKTRPTTFSIKYFKISSKGQVKTGYFTDTLDTRLPTLNLESVTQDTIDAFTHKTGLIIKSLTDINNLYTEIKRYENGSIPDLYITNPIATTSLETGKPNAIAESEKIQKVILTAVQAAAATAAAAAAAVPLAQANPDAVALAAVYGAAINNYDRVIAALAAVNTLATGGVADGKDLAVSEIDAIVQLIETRRAAADAAAAAVPLAQANPDAVVLAAVYGAAINNYDRVIAALAAVNVLATGGAADGKDLAAAEIDAIVQDIERRRTAAADAAAAAGAGAAQVDPDAVALAAVYSKAPISTDNVISILTAVNALATQASQDSIAAIVAAVKAVIPILDSVPKIISFLKSVKYTDDICGHSHNKFDDKTAALLFMVRADKTDVHFIKTRSVATRNMTTLTNHYISSDSKDILIFDNPSLPPGAPPPPGPIDTSAQMIEVLKMICLPVSFKIVNTAANNENTYGFRNRHTPAATIPYAVTDDKTVVYPFTSDNSEVDLILGRATAKQGAVVASAKFTNAPTIAKLTDLQGLLCQGIDSEKIIGKASCDLLVNRKTYLESQLSGGRRSRKRMNKNKRASSRHSRRPGHGHRHKHGHGHNSRKRYSAGSKSKSGLKSKSASKRRRNQ